MTFGFTYLRKGEEDFDNVRYVALWLRACSGRILRQRSAAVHIEPAGSAATLLPKSEWDCLRPSISAISYSTLVVRLPRNRMWSSLTTAATSMTSLR